jgi:hypothetical protein
MKKQAPLDFVGRVRWTASKARLGAHVSLL